MAGGYRAAGLTALGSAAVAAVLGLAACGTATAPGSGAAAPGSQRAAPAATGGLLSSRRAVPPAATSSATGRPASPRQGSVPVGIGPALCGGISGLRTLSVTRAVPLAGHSRFPFPARVTVTAPAQVRAVALAACQQPQLPRVMMTCPVDLGVSYRLAFAAPGRGYPVLTAAATGCAKLTGLDTARQAAPAFWVVLGKALGLAAPGQAAFAGSSS
jgi:hypothetical protein